MKSFFMPFVKSAKELERVSTICVSGMLMALSIVFRSMLYIPLGSDLRVTFAFLGSMAVCMLYGPTVGMLAAAGIDIIGYILDGAKMREYNIWLLLIKLLMAAICGLILYREKYKTMKMPKSIEKKLPVAVTENVELALRAICVRAIVVFVGNIVLNSAVLYKSYTNPSFPFMSESEWIAFKLWITPRIVKNLIMFPVECLLSILFLPIVYAAYKQVFRKTKRAAV